MPISALERGSAKARSLVKLTIASGVHKFLTGLHPTIDDALPNMASIGDVGQTLDLKTRKVTYGSTDVVFQDDGALREIITAETVKNQKIEIFQGTEALAEGAFTKIFEGVMTDAKPAEGSVTVSADDARGRVKDLLIAARDVFGSVSDMIINRHPLQIMLAILQHILPASLIDAASFDPDNFDTGSRAISHWNTARAVHGAFDRRITEATSALEILDALAMLMEGTVFTAIDGKVSFKLYDPTNPIDHSFEPEDIGKVNQTSTYKGLMNVATMLFGHRGVNNSDSDVLVRVPSGARKAPLKGEYAHQWTKADADSITKHAHPDGPVVTSGRFSESFETKWVGVNSLLEAETGAAATSITVIGGWASSFCGVDRILNGVSDGSANSGLNATDRPGFLMVQFPVGELDDGTAILAYEVIKVDDATIDFLNEGHPAVDGDSDLVGIPIRVTFTVAAGGRGQFFTNPLTLPRNSLVTDFTIPIQSTGRRLRRTVNGLPIFEFEAGLEHVDRNLADFVALPGQKVFLAEGKDGLDGTEKLEVISKRITPDSKVVFTVTTTEDPLLPNIDDTYKGPRGFLDDILKGPWDNEDAPTTDTYVPGGLELFDPGGNVIGIRRGRVCGPFGSIEVFSPGGIPQPPTVNTRDIYVFYDTHSRIFHRRDVVVGAAAPIAAKGQAIIGKIETDGGGAFVGKAEDLRLGGRMIATPEALFGMNRNVLNGSMSMRFRNSDRYPPDGLEVTPMDAVWGPVGAVGNDLELDTTAAAVESGDASARIFTPGAGLITPLHPIDADLDWLAEWKWKGTVVGGDARGIVEFIAQDRRTIVSTTTVFDKVGASPGSFQFDREALNPPSSARWIRLKFIKSLSSGPGVFVTLDSMGFKRAEDSFHVQIDIGQSLPSGVFTQIFFDAFESAGPWGAHNIGLRYQLRTFLIPLSPFFTCREQGEFEFEGAAEFTGAGVHFNVDVGLFVNGVLRKFVRSAVGVSTVNGCGYGAFRLILNQFDRVDMRLRHFTGAAESLLPSQATWFSGRQVL